MAKAPLGFAGEPNVQLDRVDVIKRAAECIQSVAVECARLKSVVSS